MHAPINEADSADRNQRPADKPHPKKVKITVDQRPEHVPPGAHVVSALKALVGVDAAKELAQVVDGQFVPLDDGATVVLDGGEIFISHPRRGGSS